ncbi:MAG: acyltransferase [Pseudomonadota bacterium]
MPLPEIPEGMRRPSSYLPEMEAWRGWAILLVLLSHWQGLLNFLSHEGYESSPIWVKWIVAGNTGVTLFFVLSGFLLCTPFIKNLRGGPPVDLSAFYFARILRIIPLYYAVVCFSLIITGKMIALRALFFIPLGIEVFPYSAPWWSLCTEAQFYLLLPLVMLLLTNRWGRLALLALLIILIVVRFQNPGWSGDYSYFGLSILGRSTAFIAGGLVSWAYQTEGGHRLLRSRTFVNATFYLSGTALLTQLAYYGGGPARAMKVFPAHYDLEAILWALIIFSSLGPVVFKNVFSNRLNIHLGTISYSLYLVHVPIQFYLLYSFPNLLTDPNVPASGRHSPEMAIRVAVSAVLCWLVAMLTYRYIEMPFLKLKSRLPTRNTNPNTVNQAPT